MLAAVMGAVLVLATAGWAVAELEKVPIPTPRYDLPLQDLVGAPAPGQTVTLIHMADNRPEIIGTGVIESFAKDPRRDAGTMRVGQMQLTPPAGVKEPRPFLDANRLEIAASGSAPAVVATVSRPVGIALYPRLYLQGAVGGAIVLVGAILVYWLTGLKASTVDFLIATDGEMKKVNWSTRKVIIDSTYVVIGATFLIAFVLFASDWMLSKFFKAIGILGA